MSLVQRIAAVAGMVAASGSALAAPPAYTIQPLPGRAMCLNDSNIAGMSRPFDATRSVGGLYNLDTGAFTALTIAMPQVTITDIADTGWLSGVLTPAGGTPTIVAWNPQRVRATIRSTTKPIINGPYVNASGRVAWGESNAGGGGRVGYTWAPSQGLRTNTQLTSVAHSVRAVNSQGWILGYSPTTDLRRATLVSAAGSTVTIPLPPGTTSSEGMDANAKNQFLLATSGGGLRGYIWNRGSNTFRELADPIGGRWMMLPSRFNDIGDVIGVGFTIATPFPEPMLWVVNTGYTFRELLGGSLPAGWSSITTPLAINDNGYILGVGVYNGAERYFVMKPVGPWHP